MDENEHCPTCGAFLFLEAPLDLILCKQCKKQWKLADYISNTKYLLQEVTKMQQTLEALK